MQILLTYYKNQNANFVTHNFFQNFPVFIHYFCEKKIKIFYTKPKQTILFKKIVFRKYFRVTKSESVLKFLNKKNPKNIPYEEN